MPNFDIYNLRFSKADSNNQLVIRGDVKNNSGKDCNAVAIRCVLFNKNIPVVNVVVVVNGLANGRTKMFEKYIEELDYSQIGTQITRQEAYIESAY